MSSIHLCGTWKTKFQPIRHLLRIGFGTSGAILVLIVLFDWIGIPLMLPKTTDAWVNAPLTSVRADSEGTFQIIRQVGETVATGDSIATMTNAFVDESPLLRLQSEKANIEGEERELQQELEIAKTLEVISSAELEKYRLSLVRELELSLQESGATVAKLEVLLGRAKRVLATNSRLKQGDLIATDIYDETSETEAVARYNLEQAQAARARIVNELDTAKRNVFIQRDSPIYLSHSLQVRLTVPQLRAKVAQTASRLDALDAELAETQKYYHRLACGIIRTPVSGIIWRRNVSSGPIGKGELLLEVAQTPQLQFIEAQFPDAHSQCLCAGAKAIILITGLKPLTGTVRVVRQPSPNELEAGYAMRLSRRLNQLRAHIEFDSVPNDPQLLGRQCTVMITDPNHRFASWHHYFDWLATKVFLLLKF